MNSSWDVPAYGVQNSTCWHLDGLLYMFLVWEFVETPLVILTNGTTLFILVKNDLLETPSNIFIACLAVSDMFSVAGLPFGICVAFLDPGTAWDVCCAINLLIHLVSSMMNMLTLFVIAADRLIFFVYALQYHSMMPLSKAWHVAYAMWAVTIPFAAVTLGTGYKSNPCGHSCLSSFMMNWISKLIYGVPFALLIPATIGIYIKIGLVALKQKRSVAPGVVPQVAPGTVEEYKITKVMLSVLVVYMTCNMVVFIVPVVLSQFPQHLRSVAVQVANHVWRTNRWVNPFIYADKSEKFRAHVRRLFPKCCRPSNKINPTVF